VPRGSLGLMGMIVKYCTHVQPTVTVCVSGCCGVDNHTGLAAAQYHVQKHSVAGAHLCCQHMPWVGICTIVSQAGCQQ